MSPLFQAEMSAQLESGKNTTTDIHTYRVISILSKTTVRITFSNHETRAIFQCSFQALGVQT